MTPKEIVETLRNQLPQPGTADFEDYPARMLCPLGLCKETWSLKNPPFNAVQFLKNRHTDLGGPKWEVEKILVRAI